MIIVQLDSEQLSNLIQTAVRKAISETTSISKADTDNWLNLQELCNYLPDKPVKPTVYGWVHHSLIPYHKKAKKLFFLKSEIDQWLKSGRRKSYSEIEASANKFVTGKEF